MLRIFIVIKQCTLNVKRDELSYNTHEARFSHFKGGHSEWFCSFENRIVFLGFYKHLNIFGFAYVVANAYLCF